MVGVEKPIAEALPEKLRLRFTVDLDESFGERGFSRDIYVTDLTEPDSITNFRKHPVTMLAENQVPLLQRLKVRFTCCQVLLGTWTVYFPHPRLRFMTHWLENGRPCLSLPSMRHILLLIVTIIMYMTTL